VNQVLVLVRDSSEKISQHIDELARQTGKLTVIHGVCPSCLCDYNTLEQRLLLDTTTTTTTYMDLLSLQASISSLSLILLLLQGAIG